MEKVPLLIPCSHRTTESNKTGSWRFLRPRYEEKTAPCAAGCPAGEDVPRIEMLTAQGSFKEAWETILLENPFPGVCGRACYYPCERACNRGEFDEPVAIRILERFLADTANHYELKPALERLRAKRERIAVVGSGPSGLAAAYFLARMGYQAEVFEAMPEPGGMLRWGIPLYRLPLDVVVQEITQIERLGVKIHCGQSISRQFLKEATAHYDAIFLGCGHSRSVPLKITGGDLPGLQDGLQFLGKIRQGERPVMQGTAAVIGGGNTAIDVARSVARLGARPIVIYRRRRQDMPAFEEEVELALAEGVEILELQTPVEITSENDDYIVTLQQMRLAGKDRQKRARVRPDSKKSHKIKVRHLFVAVGAEAAEDWYVPPKKSRGMVRLTNCLVLHRSEVPTIVFGGDLVANVKSVVHAVASGKQAAIALDTLFRAGVDAILPKLDSCLVGEGPALSFEVYLGGTRSQRSHHTVHYKDLNTDYFLFAPRISLPKLLRDERPRSFAEINLKIGTSLALREAERCFNCGICNQCDNCRVFCPEIAVIRDTNPQGRQVNYDYCKGCGLCVVECPRNAMALEEEALCNESWKAAMP